MSSTKRPWYPWYPKDFKADEKVQCLTPLAELIYRRALDLMWQSNSIRIPNAMPLLWQSLGSGIAKGDFEDAWCRIMYPEFELFRCSDDGKWLFSERLQRESEFIKDLSEKRKISGKTGANARWKKEEIANERQAHSKRIANAWQSDGHTHTHTHVLKENIEKKKTKSSRSIIPHDFQVTPEMSSWFKSQNLSNTDPVFETSKFVDHWRSKGEMKSDWVAAWRNWMRNAEKWAAEKQGPAAPVSKKWKDIDFGNLIHEE